MVTPSLRKTGYASGFTGVSPLMQPMIDATHDPLLTSWVTSANRPGAAFPIQNLPFGVFRPTAGDPTPRCGIAIGDAVLDVSRGSKSFAGPARDAAEACAAPHLNDLMALGRDASAELRRQASALLASHSEEGRLCLSGHLRGVSEVELLAPVRIAGFVDFFASINHASNAGRLFRPDEPLLPNYKYVPVAYNGRASSIMVSGTALKRPRGQTITPASAVPLYGPSAQMDYEVELGIYIGKASRLGETVKVSDAWEHVFGFSLLNDWSARDIQSWEYRPLGPFLGKSFATSVSPWVVTAEALAPFRVIPEERPPNDPAPLPYLDWAGDRQNGGLDIRMECRLNTRSMRSQKLGDVSLGSMSSRSLYWTVAQMIAHQTSNGCSLEIGDLIGSGTISGTTRDSLGSLLEITRRGAEPLTLPSGERRRFLDDGDEITIIGRCEREGRVSIGFGCCVGRIEPSCPPIGE